MSKKIKLTKVQREILEFLKDGGMIFVDKQNIGWFGDRSIQPTTRDFLTRNRLITKYDKSKPVESKGNGFIISEKGLALISELPPVKNTISQYNLSKTTKKEPATERQKEYANKLGLEYPDDINIDEMKDLISSHLEKDKIASEHHRSIADYYNVDYTKYTGKKELYERIYHKLNRPTREKELISWFTYRVYRHLVKGDENAEIKSPEHKTIQEITTELLTDESVVKSIKRYEGKDLLWFGEWTSPQGYIHTGGSKNTVAYKKVESLLKENISFESNTSDKIEKQFDTKVSYSKNYPNKLGESKKYGCLLITLVIITILSLLAI